MSPQSWFDIGVTGNLQRAGHLQSPSKYWRGYDAREEMPQSAWTCKWLYGKAGWMQKSFFFSSPFLWAATGWHGSDLGWVFPLQMMQTWKSLAGMPSSLDFSWFQV